MNIFTTRAGKIITFTIIMIFLLTQVGYGINYTREELEERIDKIAMERGVPAVLIKAIAQLESNFQQFNSNGEPKISSGGHVGLMQVGNSSNMFDMEKLKYDVDYNINAGIDVLLIKWNSSVYNNSIASVGNMDPNILENWYFALWAYNGWIDRNNPNYNTKAYQNRVYKICETYFDQSINPIDISKLPVSGRPSRGTNIATPSSANYANIAQYSENDIIVINNLTGNRNLYDAPSGKYLCDVNNGQMAQIVEGPILMDGYYWYKVHVNDQTAGWIERNWIKKVGDVEHGIYPFKDIIYHWSAKAVMNLYNLKLISGRTITEFCPDDNITREEFCALFSKVFNISAESEGDIRFTNTESISSWAIDYIKALDENNLLGIYDDEAKFSANISRGEITYIIAKYLAALEKDKFEKESISLVEEREFDIKTAFRLDEIELPFGDIDGLNEWQNNNLKIVYSKNIISGESSDTFNYNGYITRAAAASVMNKLYNMFNK